MNGQSPGPVEPSLAGAPVHLLAADGLLSEPCFWSPPPVNPRPYFDHLVAGVAQRSLLRQACALAEDAPGLTDEQLRARLAALAGRAVGEQHPVSIHPERGSL